VKGRRTETKRKGVREGGREGENGGVRDLVVSLSMAIYG
jgi:hypothetical protein